MTKHIVVIGGGIAGLSAALRLKHTFGEKSDVTCTVIESSARFGGKIATHREDGFVMELGPDSLLARKPAGPELIKQLGLHSEIMEMNPSAGKTYMLHQGDLVDMPQGTHMGIPTNAQTVRNTPLVSSGGKARALMDLVLPGEDYDGTDMSLGTLLRQRLGDEWVTQVCEPLMAGIYAAKIDDLSLLSTFPQIATMAKSHRSLIRAAHDMQQRMMQAPKPASPTTGRSTFITLRGGLQTLVERLYDELRDWADLRSETEVVQVDKLHGRYSVRVRSTKSPETSFEMLQADSIIVTVPTYVVSQLLSGISATAASLSAIRYASTATVVLGYAPSALDGFEGSGFLVPRSEAAQITACTWTSNKWPHTATDNRVLIRCYVGRSGQTDALSLNDEDMAAMVHETLARAIGVKERPWFHRIARWDKAMPQFEVGHQELVRHVETQLATDAPGVYLAGAGYHGIGVPDCIQSGWDAADGVIRHLHGMSDVGAGAPL